MHWHALKNLESALGPPQVGTLLATQAGQRRFRGWRQVLAAQMGRSLVYLGCLGSLLLAGCIVPAPVDDGVQAVPPIVLIKKEKLDPKLLEPVLISRASEDGRGFSARSAVVTAGGVASLNYYWYYDFDPTDGGNLDKYSICGNQDQCTVFPCQLVSYSQDQHELMLVVSNKPRNDKPTNPHDFPEGTALDMAVWTLQLEDACK